MFRREHDGAGVPGRLPAHPELRHLLPPGGLQLAPGGELQGQGQVRRDLRLQAVQGVPQKVRL